MFDFSLVCIPTSTFSSAVMFWNRRMFWNVRPTPASTMSFGRALLNTPNLVRSFDVPGWSDDRQQQGHDERRDSEQDSGFKNAGTKDRTT